MYLQTVSDLRKASVPIRELPGPGAVAVTLAAGRIVALAFSKEARTCSGRIRIWAV